jgi:hypothetical protein
MFAKCEFLMGLLGSLGAASLVALVSDHRRSQYKPATDPAALTQALGQVVDAYRSLVHFGQFLEHESNEPEADCAGAFAMYGRKLGGFFGKEAGDASRARAVHYCTQRHLQKMRLPHYNRWRRAMEKLIAPIHYEQADRIAQHNSEAGERVRLLLSEMRDAFALFSEHIDDQYKPEFIARMGELSCRKPATT